MMFAFIIFMMTPARYHSQRLALCFSPDIFLTAHAEDAATPHGNVIGRFPSSADRSHVFAAAPPPA